jgi:ATP-binding cassette subfamily B protein
MRIFVRVAALFWRYWPRAALAYTCLFAGAVLTILIPRFTGQAIDLALGSGQHSALALLALAILAAGILRSLFSYGQGYLAEFLSNKVAYDLRNTIYNRLQTLSYAFHDRAQTGQLMSRATSDVEAVRMFVGFALLRGFYFVLLMVAITVVLMVLNWKLALISLSVLPFISFRTVVINQKLRVLWMKIQQGIGDLGTILQENLTGVRVVRAFAREDFESKKFRNQAETIYNQEIQANNLLASNSPAMSFALLLAMGVVLWYGGRLVIAGSLTQGELAQFLIYLVMLSTPVYILGWLSILFSRAMASGKRIFEIIDQVSPVQEKPDAIDIRQIDGLVRFDNVSFTYDSHGTALKDVSFEAKPGQIIALVGASGSGKSTIANLIPRFYDVTTGNITIDGTDIRDMTLASLRSHVGIVHQDTFLFSATIRENISYGKPDACLKEIMDASSTARLHDFIMSLPDGYDTWVGERGITLSGGQKQRLAIARTVLLDPRILIMDDSTSSLDAETEYLLQQALAELPSGRTTFIIAHRLRSVEMADLILVLKDGQIIERGIHDELLARNGWYQQLYGLQFEQQEVLPETSAMHPAHDEGASAYPAESGYQTTHVRSEQVSNLRISDDLVYGKPYDSRVVSRLARYFAPYKVALPLTIVATLLYTFTIVANPYLVGVAEDNYIVAGNLSGLNIIVLIFLGVAFLNGLSYYAQIRAEARLGQSILLNLRSQLFNHLQRLSLRFIEGNEVGRVMSRVQDDVGEVGDFLDSGVFWVAGEFVSLIAIVVAMFAMNLTLAVLTLTVVPLLFAFIMLWQTTARRSFIKVRQALAPVNAALQENISGVRVIQSLSREELNSQHFEKVNYKHFASNVQAARLSAAMMPGVELLLALSTVIIVFYGGGGVLSGTLLVGTLLAFILYMQNFFDPIRSLTMEYSQLQMSMASGARVFELLDVKPEMSSGKTKLGRIHGDIKFEGVSFSYEPEVEVLHNMNLHMPAGKTVALVGPTGAGKSTIVSLIARFYDVNKGRILIDGHDLRHIDLAGYRQQIGLVLQDPFLFSGTVSDNIRYGNLEASEDEIVSAARTVGAHDFVVRLEKGYDTEIQERGQNLSMGQRQLISFARALLSNPAILLLDEATASVDSYSEHVLQQGLQNLLKGRTTIVIAHRLSTIRDADLILVIDHGRLIEQGRHEELLRSGGLYARLYEMIYARLGVRTKPIR